MKQRHVIHSEAEMLAFAAGFSKTCTAPSVIFLYGELGAGKTTFVRGLLRGLGYQHHVKSPSYTIVEPYAFADWLIYHIDLYRLGDPQELEFLGIREYMQQKAICLIEWPEKGAGYLPAADTTIHIQIENNARIVLIRETKIR